EPVGTLNWPSMTMGFMVMDKALLEKLSVGKTVDFDFVQSGKGYAITSVR
ncbi:MAG: copper-binding protein, partial [Alphaproteobacteria bacterium]